MATVDELKEELEKLKLAIAAGGMKAKPQVIVQSPPKIKKYSGDRKELKSWIADTERCISIQGLEDERAVDYILNNLEGRALMEVEYLPKDQRATTDQIFKILKRAFGEIASTSQLEDLYLARRQKPGENIMDFSYALMDLQQRLLRVNETYVKDKDVSLRDKFADRVREVDLRRYLKDKIQNNPTMTFAKVRELATNWVAEEPSKSDSLVQDVVEVSSNPDTGMLSQILNLQRQQQEQINKLQQQQQDQLNQQTQMFQQLLAKGVPNTGKDNNSFKTDKDTIKKCFFCGILGHFKSDCRKFKQFNNRKVQSNVVHQTYGAMGYSYPTLGPSADFSIPPPPAGMYQYYAPPTQPTPTPQQYKQYSRTPVTPIAPPPEQPKDGALLNV